MNAVNQVGDVSDVVHYTIIAYICAIRIHVTLIKAKVM